MYYKCIKLYSDGAKIDYWKSSNITPISRAYDFLIPLGTCKPRNIAKENIHYDL